MQLHEIVFSSGFFLWRIVIRPLAIQIFGVGLALGPQITIYKTMIRNCGKVLKYVFKSMTFSSESFRFDAIQNAV